MPESYVTSEFARQAVVYCILLPTYAEVGTIKSAENQVVPERQCILELLFVEQKPVVTLLVAAMSTSMKHLFLKVAEADGGLLVTASSPIQSCACR